MRARSASGSVDSPSAVEPTRSQKRTVTTLRCSRTANERGSAAAASPSAVHSPAAGRPRRRCLRVVERDRAPRAIAASTPGSTAPRLARARLERSPPFSSRKSIDSAPRPPTSSRLAAPRRAPLAAHLEDAECRPSIGCERQGRRLPRSPLVSSAKSRPRRRSLHREETLRDRRPVSQRTPCLRSRRGGRGRVRSTVLRARDRPPSRARPDVHRVGCLPALQVELLDQRPSSRRTPTPPRRPRQRVEQRKNCSASRLAIVGHSRRSARSSYAMRLVLPGSGPTEPAELVLRVARLATAVASDHERPLDVRSPSPPLPSMKPDIPISRIRRARSALSSLERLERSRAPRPARPRQSPRELTRVRRSGEPRARARPHRPSAALIASRARRTGRGRSSSRAAACARKLPNQAWSASVIAAGGLPPVEERAPRQGSRGRPDAAPRPARASARHGRPRELLVLRQLGSKDRAPARGGSRRSRPARKRSSPVRSSQSAKRSWSWARMLLRHRRVGRIPDEEMPEPKARRPERASARAG